VFQGFISGFKSLFAGKSNSSGITNFEERRKLVRMRCSYEVKGQHGQKKFKATVVDIGLQGLKMRTGEKLKVGDKLVLSPPAEGVGNTAAPVEGKVLWVKSKDKTFARHVGILFTTKKEEMGQSWVKLLLKELGFKPKSIFSNRRFVRADCFLDAKYYAPSVSREVTGRVYNLGVGGMLLESNYELPLGEGAEMEFVPPEGLPILRLMAYPKQSKKEGTVRLIGLEFRDLTSRQLDVLGQYLKQLLQASFSNERA
jgi:c-di-GMP-binding flagellar brake protein YcgR